MIKTVVVVKTVVLVVKTGVKNQMTGKVMIKKPTEQICRELAREAGKHQNKPKTASKQAYESIKISLNPKP